MLAVKFLGAINGRLHRAKILACAKERQSGVHQLPE